MIVCCDTEGVWAGAGRVQKAEKETGQYAFNLGKRQDMSWDHHYLPPNHLPECAPRSSPAKGPELTVA